MTLETFIAMRYLKAKRKEAFINVITVISVLSVMIGVMALVVVLSVMNGFRRDLTSKILGVNSHMLVFHYQGTIRDHEAIGKKMSAIDGIIATTPFVYAQVMVNGKGNASTALLRGLDPGTVGDVLVVDSMIKQGSLTSLEHRDPEFPGIILGRELSKKIKVNPGDIVTVLSPDGKRTAEGRVPKTKEFKVTAVFDSGMYDYDKALAFIGLNESQELLGLNDRVTGLEVKVRDIFQAGALAKSVQNELGYPYYARDWMSMNKSLFAMLKLQKITLGIILSMIVIVGGLSIIGTLVMLVIEKVKDIAILRSMGISAKGIMKIFIFQGVFIGIVGTAAGLISGFGICFLLSKYKFITLPADVYYISTLSVLIQMGDVFWVAFSAVSIAFLATLYPSWRASRLNPVEAIRYE